MDLMKNSKQKHYVIRNITPQTFENEIIYRSKDGSPSILFKITAISV